jgi:hypothetical protein
LLCVGDVFMLVGGMWLRLQRGTCKVTTLLVAATKCDCGFKGCF